MCPVQVQVLGLTREQDVMQTPSLVQLLLQKQEDKCQVWYKGSAKMVEQKGPELTSSYKHTKVTSICTTTIDEVDQNLPEKIFYS